MGDRDEATDGAGSDGGRLSFPDLPRLELDQLLEQLVQRANEVMGTQGRLRGLLRASQMVIGNLALPTVLRSIAEAARELVGARYAALGVIGSDGHLAEFVHVGMPGEVVDRIGRLPQGKGLLGALVEDPRPIRLSRITDDPRSSGFPDEHPPMGSFLGVPIRVRGVVFGNLYLADNANGQFSAEDEELATALAATAGIAIENARLYQASRMRQKWLQASDAITRRLLSPDPGSPLTLIAEHARDNADADVVTVLRPTATEGELRVEVAVGVGAEDLLGVTVPVRGTLSGRVFSSGVPVLGSWQESQARLDTVPRTRLDVDPVLVVPLIGSGQINGVLTVARRTGSPRFTTDDLDMAAAFANQASVSIELADARAEQQRNALYDERDRIAADLHTQVIHRLSSAGLSLQRAAAGARGETADRIRTTIGALDGVISQIRTTVFQLQDVVPPQTATVRHRLLDVLTTSTRLLGFAPTLQLVGRLDVVRSGALADDLVATVRDAVDAIARDATAGSADITVRADADRVTVEVVHDGGDPVDGGTASERDRHAERAARHGGTSRLTRAEPGRTQLVWSVPTR